MAEKIIIPHNSDLFHTLDGGRCRLNDRRGGRGHHEGRGPSRGRGRGRLHGGDRVLPEKAGKQLRRKLLSFCQSQELGQ